MTTQAVHFVGFRDDRFWNAVRVFGRPHFVHRNWDRRCLEDAAPDDVFVFASGDESRPFASSSFDDSAVF